jgi:hypothetical protein
LASALDELFDITIRYIPINHTSLDDVHTLAVQKDTLPNYYGYTIQHIPTKTYTGAFKNKIHDNLQRALVMSKASSLVGYIHDWTRREREEFQIITLAICETHRVPLPCISKTKPYATNSTRFQSNIVGGTARKGWHYIASSKNTKSYQTISTGASP